MMDSSKVKMNKVLIQGLPPLYQTCLLNSPLLNTLSGSLQEELLRLGSIRSIKKKELLFMDGDPINSIYFIFSGKLKEYYSTETGEICLRRILDSCSYVSLHLMFSDQQVYSYTCEAVSKTLYFRWGLDNFMKILNREPRLGYQVASIISCSFENSCRLHCLCRKTQSVSRVAGYILRQCNPLYLNPGFHPKESKQNLQADIRPLEQAANNICLARETFSRALSFLQKKKYIRLKNGIVDILDIEALKETSGIP